MRRSISDRYHMLFVRIVLLVIRKGQKVSVMLATEQKDTACESEERPLTFVQVDGVGSEHVHDVDVLPQVAQDLELDHEALEVSDVDV